MSERIEATYATISSVKNLEGKLARLEGWLYNKRSSGKILFLILRDGTGVIQCVATKNELGDDLSSDLTGSTRNRHSSLRVRFTKTIAPQEGMKSRSSIAGSCRKPGPITP